MKKYNRDGGLYSVVKSGIFPKCQKLCWGEGGDADETNRDVIYYLNYLQLCNVNCNDVIISLIILTPMGMNLTKPFFSKNAFHNPHNVNKIARQKNSWNQINQYLFVKLHFWQF